MKSEKQLFQWDVNQYLTELQPEAQFVDYPMGNEVIRIEADGKRCRIPDEFLQDAGFKTCYERYSDGTYKAYSFNVLSSPKPPDYVYTADERTTFEALVEKADAAIDEIKRRADSGEFTPVKGVDYFTDSEKAEMMESVSSGAVGEFRKVVDGATTEYNDNHNLKLAKYNANASEKLTTYDTNAEQHTTDYNRNAEQKLEAYNKNHTEKVAEYNQNAAALQTEVDRLRGECDTLGAENRKQETRIDALIKLNKGQTYDILPEDGEAASRTAPSGAKYVSVDKVGGRSVVWNQLNNPADNINVQKGAIKLNDDGSITISGTVQDAGKYNELQISQSIVFVRNQKYLVRTNKILSICVNGHDKSTTDALLYAGVSDWTGYVALGVANGDEVNIEELTVQVYNLTQMFGAGNEPTVEQFKKLFAQKIYPYNAGEIISSTTANVELEGKNLWDDSDPAFTQVLTKAGFTFDGIVWKSELIDYIATPIKIEKGKKFSYDIKAPKGANVRFKFAMDSGNLIYRPHESDGSWKHHSVYLADDVHTIYVDYTQRASCEIKNIQLERGTTETAYSPHTKQTITTGFPELRSALAAHDYIDMDGGKVHRKIKSVRIDGDTPIYGVSVDSDANCCRIVFENQLTPGIIGSKNEKVKSNVISDRLATISHADYWDNSLRASGINIYESLQAVCFRLHDRMDIDTKEKAKAWLAENPTTVYYEIESEELEDVTIPEALQEWLPVEPGGTVTFRNGDDSKQLALPNAVSWVRKLDEVN